MWVIRAGERDRLLPAFVDQGVIGISFPEVPDAEILTRSEIRRFLADGRTKTELDAQEELVSAFVREIQPGDSVLLLDTSRGEVVVGTVTGRYAFDGDAASDGVQHVRTVDWLARHEITDLPEAVRGVARQKADLQQHRDAEWSGYLAQVREGGVGRDPKDRPVRTVAPRAARAPRAAAPRAPKPAAIAQRTCTSCFLQTHPDRMRGDICVDCAE